VTYWDDLSRHTDLVSIWMAHPLVRAAINTRVSGDPSVWPVEALKREIAAHIPVQAAVSIGCGLGSLERSLIDEGVVSSITAVDISDTAIAEARRAAGSRPVEYVRADAREYLRAHPTSFDAVFFHQSLHHFDSLDGLMALVRTALRPRGFLYIDEYAGPSRDEWSPWKLLVPNIAYRMLPRSTWRPHLVRAPINREDPTEAIRSSGILPAIDKQFVSVNRRDYGGNLLSVIYPNLAQTDKRAFDAAVRKLIGMEDQLLRLGAASFYTVMLARPRA
jgi:O-antigen biosynthesis protein